MKDAISLIFLAGGIGSRIKSTIPKQFLLLQDMPIIKFSLDVFFQVPEIQEIIVVCAPQYRFFFKEYPSVSFAEPGARRQDSVYNGLKNTNPDHRWVCIHDAARPFISREMIDRLIKTGKEHGAATVAVPLKSTVKQVKQEFFVEKTMDRSLLWEIQTPQFLARGIIENGFEVANKNQITVTDDTSLAELVSHPVKLVEGSYKNFKITTDEDLILANYFVSHA